MCWFNDIYQPDGLPWWLSGKESACNSEDTVSIPGLGRFPGGGNDNPFQYSCLENPMDSVAPWQATVHELTKRQTWPSDWVCSNGITTFKKKCFLQYVNYYSDMLSSLQLELYHIYWIGQTIHSGSECVVQYSSWCIWKSMYFIFT